MKTKSLLAIGALLVSSACVFAAPDAKDAAAAKQLQIYPKNLARQNVGTNLFVFDATSQNYIPTQAAAAWLDDDVATGWPPGTGKSYYLLTLSEPQLLTNFAISTKTGAGGTVTIYTNSNDEPAPPTAKSWTPLVKDLSIEAINNKKMAKPFSHFAKYLLIETNAADANPWYSLYVYGESPAASFRLSKRAKSIDTSAIFGQYMNNLTMFNVSGLYSGASVVYSNTNNNPVDLQKAIDDNPESSINIAPSKSESGMIIRLGDARMVQRISVMADPASKGRLEFFLVGSLPAAANSQPAAANKLESQYMTVANTIPPSDTASTDAPVATASSGAVSLDGLSPNATMVLDGSTGRNSIEFPAVSASYIIVRWTPETAGQSVAISEINSFADLSLNDYQLVSDMPAIADGGAAGDVSKDGKDMSKDKNVVPPVGEGPLPGKDPFLPGGLGFPPNLTHFISP